MIDTLMIISVVGVFIGVYLIGSELRKSECYISAKYNEINSRFRYQAQFLEHTMEEINKRIDIYNASHQRILDEENRLYEEWRAAVDNRKTTSSKEQ